MIRSMTGYAALSSEIGQALLAVELKSVNSRFLDLQFRLPEELRPAEPALRELLAAAVSRGKIECRMAIQPSAGTAPQLAINEALLAALAQAERKVLDALPAAQPLRVGEILHWPGMLANEETGADTLREASVALLKSALAEFAATRAREGDKLKDMILERIDRMQARLALIESHVPEAIAAYQEKLATRLREALATSDEERIRHEIALFGVKIDIAEELNRLGAHLAGGAARPRCRRRGGQAPGFPDAGTEPRGEHPRIEIGVQGTLRHEPGIQAAHRADARADPEHRVKSSPVW